MPLTPDQSRALKSLETNSPGAAEGGGAAPKKRSSWANIVEGKRYTPGKGCGLLPSDAVSSSDAPTLEPEVPPTVDEQDLRAKLDEKKVEKKKKKKKKKKPLPSFLP